MKPNATLLPMLLLIAGAALTQADVLEPKNAERSTATYAGGTIRGETLQQMTVLQASQTLASSFGAGTPVATDPPGPATAAPTPAAAAPARASTVISVPAGTTLLVRMLDGASSDDSKGKRFTTTLETDLVVNGRVIAKAGTKVYGRVENAQRARRYAGKSLLDLRLTEINVGGTLAPIITGSYAQAGAGAGRKTARGAAAGAAIGAVAGDAGKGAAIGAVASGLKKGQPVVIQPGTLLEFQLQQPLTIKTSP